MKGRKSIKEMNKDNNKERKTYLEVLRVIACIFVLCIHTAVAGEYEKQEAGSMDYFFYLFISVFIRCAVPLFFMISGVTLLEKKESLIYVWKKRIWKIFVALIGASFFYYLCDVYIGKEQFDITRFFIVFFNEGWVVPFWFLYAYIGFLMVLPLIRILAQNLDKRKFEYLVVLFFIFETLIPFLSLFSSYVKFNSYIGISGLASIVIIYPLLGYYIEKHINMKSKIYLLPLWIINMLLLFSVTYNTMALGDGSVDGSYSIAVNAVSIFITTKVLFDKNKENLWNKILCTIGACTFGIYLLHPMLLERIRLLNKIWMAIQNNLSWINVMIMDFLYVIWIFTIGFLIVYVLKKLPIIKNYI